MKNIVSTIVVFGSMFIIILVGAFIFDKFNGFGLIENVDSSLNNGIKKVLDSDNITEEIIEELDIDDNSSLNMKNNTVNSSDNITNEDNKTINMDNKSINNDNITDNNTNINIDNKTAPDNISTGAAI